MSIIGKVLCHLGSHNYEYRGEAFPSLTLHRGCKRCEKAEYNRTGHYWTPWRKGWTWTKAKQTDLLTKPKIFEQRIERLVKLHSGAKNNG